MNFEEAMNSLEGAVINLSEIPFTAFEVWFEDQDFYTNMRFIHGDKLFDRDGDAYRVLLVQMAYQAWDYRKAQLNNMEQCYIQLKQEHNELIAFNTVQDRMQKAAEKVAEKYKRKVSMIADLLRDSTDKDMTLKAIQTVIERVGEHV